MFFQSRPRFYKTFFEDEINVNISITWFIRGPFAIEQFWIADFVNKGFKKIDLIDTEIEICFAEAKIG